MVSQAQRVPSPAVAAAPPPSSLLPQRRTQHQQRSNTTSSEQHDINSSSSSNNNNTFSPSRNSSSSNNNLQMERVTFHLHSRLCNFGLTHTTSRTRNVLEHLLLILAICCACALLMLHRTFVAAPSCLDLLEGFDPSRADLTHLLILPHNLTKSSELMEPKSTVLWSRKTSDEQNNKIPPRSVLMTKTPQLIPTIRNGWKSSSNRTPCQSPSRIPPPRPF